MENMVFTTQKRNMAFTMENMVFTMERSGGGKALFGYMPKPNPKTMPKPNLNPNLTNTITKIMPKPNLETTPTWSKDLQQLESYWAKLGISGEKTGYLFHPLDSNEKHLALQGTD